LFNTIHRQITRPVRLMRLALVVVQTLDNQESSHQQDYDY
jgi:hypothetical protein